MMSTFAKFSLALCLVAGLTGCAPNRVYLSRHVSLALRSPGQLGAPALAARLTYRDKRGRRLQLLLQLESSAKQLLVSGLSDFGQRLFWLRFDARGLRLSTEPPFQMPVEARQFLAALQLMLWPAAAIRRGLTGGATFAVVRRDGLEIRHLWRGSVLLVEIQRQRLKKNRRRIVMRHMSAGFRITLETVVLP